MASGTKQFYKAEKMENDFREIAAKIQELDWKESKKLSRC